MTGEADLLPLCPFPPLPWWGAICGKAARLDGLEHYQKRSFRNRYCVMQSDGLMQLTVPVERRGGRPRPQDETRRVMGDADRKAWQAVRTAYGRAPYFEEMADGLEALFLRGPETLGGWNRATVAWAAEWMGISVPGDVQAEEFHVVDHGVRMLQWQDGAAHGLVRWPHVWEDRHRDIPFERLGILDALLHVGPAAAEWVKPVPPSGSPHLR